MRSCGIDIASTGYSAIALVVNGEPSKAVAWKPNEKDSEPERLNQFYNWMRFQFGLFQPDVIAVEKVTYVQNHAVAMMISKFEGVALLAGKRHGAFVVNPQATMMRGIVFGNGRLSKDKAWKEIRVMYPNFEFGKVSEGAKDKADAIGHAIAAPIVLERRK